MRRATSMSIIAVAALLLSACTSAGTDTAPSTSGDAGASPSGPVGIIATRVTWPPMLAEVLPAATEEPAAGAESCTFVTDEGEFVAANAAHLTAIIEAYEAEQARVCSETPNCFDDQGAMTTFADTEQDLAGGDGTHLTTKGQARTAALIWPVAADILGY